MSKSKDGKNWLTVQLADDQVSQLDKYAKKHRITKTEVIRRYLDKLESVDLLIEMIEQSGLQKLNKMLRTIGK